MSGEPIGVSDLVGYVYEDGDGVRFGLLKVGSIYVCLGGAPANPAGCLCKEQLQHGILIEGVPSPSKTHGWCSFSFRPISRRSDFEKVLEQLKQPVPELIEA